MNIASKALAQLDRIRRLMSETIPLLDVTPEPEQEPPFFMVWRPMGMPPIKCHSARSYAETEAERVARLHPGHDVFVLAPVTRLRATRVEREDFDRAHPLNCMCASCDEVPF